MDLRADLEFYLIDVRFEDLEDGVIYVGSSRNGLWFEGGS